MYSISLSPEEDTPEVLKRYMKERGIGPGWTFYTGKPGDILFLRKSLGFLYNNPKEDADRNNHIGMLQIGDEPLTRWAHAEGGASPEWIASVIRNEADSPFKGSAGGVRLVESVSHGKTIPSERKETRAASPRPRLTNGRVGNHSSLFLFLTPYAGPRGSTGAR